MELSPLNCLFIRSAGTSTNYVLAAS